MPSFWIHAQQKQPILHVLSRDVFLCHLHVPEPIRPDHHIGAEGTEIHAAAFSNPDFPFQVEFLADFFELLYDLFGAAVTAGRTLPLPVVNADVNPIMLNK